MTATGPLLLLLSAFWLLPQKDVSKLFPFFFELLKTITIQLLAVDAIAHARLCMHNTRTCATTPLQKKGKTLFLALKSRRFLFSARLKWLAFWIILHDFNRRVDYRESRSTWAPQLYGERACHRSSSILVVFFLNYFLGFSFFVDSSSIATRLIKWISSEKNLEFI